MRELRELQAVPYVDTHCHLDEVLQQVRRHDAVPTFNKHVRDFSAEELGHWRTLGWVKEVKSTAPLSQKTLYLMWDLGWAELSAAERQAATVLGYDATAWDDMQWLSPLSMSWSKLSREVQQSLSVLGESEAVWDNRAKRSRTRNVVNCNDSRGWAQLSATHRAAAVAIGFSQATWDNEELADVHQTVDKFFGAGFQGCVTQGCDAESIDPAQELALSHPKVFVSFGCHPKAAWMYDDKLEARFINAADACGAKVVAWGEFGLDYSHWYFGKIASNRRVQKDVFARQLKLAIKRGLPMVLHSRAADRDTLRMMRRWVPRDWKVHVHSFRGTVQFMKMLISEFQHTYIGIPGIVTMDDKEAHELCRECPLERMVLETDAPYLPVNSAYFSHPGQIPEITVQVAELKGCSVGEVSAMMRKNARILYGI